LAIYHFQMKTLSRSTGRSATAAAAYRSGQKIEDERTGQTYDYSRRSGVLMAEVILPNGGQVEREQLWNAAESAENRCNSVVAREFVVALPHELSREQQTELVKGYAQGLSERTGWAVDVAIHEPGREGDLRNVHAHLLCTTRTVSLDPAGCPVMESKTREWDIRSSGSELLRAERAEWERCVNQSLEQANRIERVDCRSHAEKQTGLEPQVHLGPTAMAMERKGIQTEQGDKHRQIAAHNAQVIQFQEVQAARIDEAFEVDLWNHKLNQMKQMPLEQLQKEREKYKPQSVDALIEQDPAVKAAQEYSSQLKAEHAGIEKGLSDHRYALQLHAAEAERYREAHPWKARLHDLRVKPDKELAYRTEADTALNAGKKELEKQLEVSQRLNMQALQSLDEARGHAMPQAIETHGIQAERFRQVEAIYQPQKEKQIVQEQEQRKQKELQKQQEREKERQKERERGGGRGMSR
jgi:hypothetical protein